LQDCKARWSGHRVYSASLYKNLTYYWYMTCFHCMLVDIFILMLANTTTCLCI